jgi:hypothetical protein
MPIEVHLTYLVPVCVVVHNDGAGPRISRVLVNDAEELKSGEAYSADGEMLRYDDPTVIEAKNLVELHAQQAKWPAWEFGW